MSLRRKTEALLDQDAREPLRARAPNVELEHVRLPELLAHEDDVRRRDKSIDIAETVEGNLDADAVVDEALLDVGVAQRLRRRVAIGSRQSVRAELHAAEPAHHDHCGIEQ